MTVVTTPVMTREAGAMTIWMIVWSRPCRRRGRSRWRAGRHRRCPRAGDQVDTDDVEAVVVTEAELQPTAYAARTPATRPRMIDPIGESAPHAGVMATRPATTPEAAPIEVA